MGGLGDKFLSRKGERHGFAQRILSAAHAEGERGLCRTAITYRCRCGQVSEEDL